MSTLLQEDRTVVIYEPNQRVKMGFVRSWVYMLQNIYLSRDLVWQLFKRDFVSGYKQSFFGVFWLFISPLLGILSWVFMNMTGILHPGDVGVPYPVYILLGTTLWGLFMNFYTSIASSLASGGSLILQVNFPHEALVAQQVAQTIANFLINILMISLIVALFGVSVTWKVIFFPLTLIPLFLMGSAIGMVVAVITVVVHDINKMVQFLLSILMFLTPVVYASTIQNAFIQKIIPMNPMTYLIGGARDIILHGRINNSLPYGVSCVVATVLFLFSWRFFFLSEHKVAEKI